MVRPQKVRLPKANAAARSDSSGDVAADAADVALTSDCVGPVVCPA